MGPWLAAFKSSPLDQLDGPRWELARNLLQRGEWAVNLRGLVLRTDTATAKTGRRLHNEFDCPFLARGPLCPRASVGA